MTTAELETILRRLQEAAPTSRLSRKRQLLAGARDTIIALHQRGHSWRSLARELSAATGENISADLLRTACLQRRRLGRRAQSAPAKSLQPTTRASVAVAALAPKPAAKSGNERFGARGLEL